MGGQVLCEDGVDAEAATFWSIQEARAPFRVPAALVQIQEHEDAGKEVGGDGLETAGVVPETSVPEGSFPFEPTLKPLGPGAEDGRWDLAPESGDGGGALV